MNYKTFMWHNLKITNNIFNFQIECEIHRCDYLIISTKSIWKGF